MYELIMFNFNDFFNTLYLLYKHVSIRDLFYSFVHQLTPFLHVNACTEIYNESSFNAKYKGRLHMRTGLEMR
jgi:hypothetical protein